MASAIVAGSSFLRKHVYIGQIEVGRYSVPHWRYDWRATDRSKYMPHQGYNEMERRRSR